VAIEAVDDERGDQVGLVHRLLVATELACLLETLLAQCDIVSLHLPLTPQSRYLIKAETVARMKRGAFLINTSRGKLIDTTAVIDALKRGHLGGVALDVYEEEEGDESPMSEEGDESPMSEDCEHHCKANGMECTH
jgi:lactate dehydrogenase-like 2-hydroxyacid dehydrogenase